MADEKDTKREHDAVVLPSERLLRVNTVARILGYSRWTIYRMVERGELEAVKQDGHHIRITQSSLASYLTQTTRWRPKPPAHATPCSTMQHNPAR